MSFARARCAHCKAKLDPGQRIHPQCIDGYADATAAKAERSQAKAQRLAKTQERKADSVKRVKLKSRSDWQREAQTAANAFVRARDAELPCISCGRHHGGQYHAGHYRSVGSAPHLRFDVERNIHKQCQPCNTHLHGNLIQYRVALIERIGLEAVEALECDQAPRNYTIDDFIAIKIKYKAKIKQLQNSL